MACMQKSKYRRDKPKYDDMDNLARDAALAKDAGMSYGQWKAMYPNTKVDELKIKPVKKEVEPGWKVCPHCGKKFKPNKFASTRQTYCEIGCQKEAQKARDKDKMREYYREYMAKKRAEGRT